jgi:hypothetical protein
LDLECSFRKKAYEAYRLARRMADDPDNPDETGLAEWAAVSRRFGKLKGIRLRYATSLYWRKCSAMLRGTLP